MSIGLMVDYVIHIVFNYFETTQYANRKFKVKHVMETMGASILIGGSSTMLGVIPLAFSTSQIFLTIFAVFFSFVSFALLHGLALMPIILSICGPISPVKLIEEDDLANVDDTLDKVRKRTASTELAEGDEFIDEVS